MTIVYQITSPNGRSYIGVSRNFNRRLKDHATSNTLVGKAIRKYGLENMIIKTLLEGEDDYCFLMEERIVHIFGTLSPGGYNQTIGGMGGRGLGPEAVEAKRAANLAWYAIPQNRELNKQRSNTPECKAQRKKLAEERWADEKQRASLLASRRTPEARLNRSISMKRVQNEPYVVEKKRQAAQAQWADPEKRAKALEGMAAARARKNA